MKRSVILFVSGLLSSHVLAQETGTSAAGQAYFEVSGIASDDLLNIRASASPTGMIVARLENGAVLKNLGCSDVGTYRWCKVQDVGNPRVTGWAAARYLIEVELEIINEGGG